MSHCCHCYEGTPCAAQIAILQHLDEESLRKISALATHRTYSKGDILFSPENHGGLFLISEGKVKVYEISASGKEQLHRVLSEGDFTGEDALFGNSEGFTFGEAITDVSVCFICREDFMNLLMRYPSISLKLLEEFNRRMRLTDHQITMNTVETPLDRLKTYLRELSKAQDSSTVQLSMSMKELAAFLSTAPETLSRRMKMLEEQGYLKRNGRQITLLNQSNTI